MSDCELSLQGRAFSTILTAIVGSVVTGVSDGPLVAFFIGWICWLAAVRLVLVSGAGLLVTICGPVFGFRQPFLCTLPTTESDDHEEFALTSIRTTNGSGNGNGKSHVEDGSAQNHMSSRFSEEPSKPPAQSHMSSTFSGEFSNFLSDGAIESNSAVDKIDVNNENNVNATAGNNIPFDLEILRRNRDVTFLGSMGWIYKFIYTPIIQVMWIKSNWSEAPSVLLVSRAISLSVTALSYTIDTQARYGTALGNKLGSKKVVPRLMNLYNAVTNMMLSIIVVVLLVHALQISIKSDGGTIFKGVIAPYVVFSIIWALVSLKLLWPSDEGWNGVSIPLKALWSCDAPMVKTFGNVFLGLFVGAFAGVFVASPAIVMWQNAKFEKWGQEHGLPSDQRYTDGKDLGAWLHCTTDSWWQQAVQVLP